MSTSIEVGYAVIGRDGSDYQEFTKGTREENLRQAQIAKASNPEWLSIHRIEKPSAYRTY